MSRGEVIDHLIGPAILVGLAVLILFIHYLGQYLKARKREKAVARGEVLPPPVPAAKWPWRRGLISSAALAALYLLLFRALSLTPSFNADHAGGAILMSFSFLFLGPFVAGYITVDQAAAREPLPTYQWFLAPWIPILLNLALALAVAWEGIICAVFIVPPALMSASIGGLVAGLFHGYRHKKASNTTLLCLAAAPLLLCMLEVQLNQPLELRTVNTAITIHASAPIVWRNIERVRAIAPAELKPSWANLIGFPRPVEATLSHEGVGGVRNASFEHGLNFVETVTDWDPDQRIAFTIVADTAAIPSTTLDEHVTVGGRFFDVLTGEYRIEPLANGDTLLHLASHQRLSTDFNAYAAMWSDAVMGDMQNNILHVVRNRCEAEAKQQAHASVTINPIP